MVKLTRKENSTNTKKKGILRLLIALFRYISRKVRAFYKKLTKKEQKKTDKVVNKSIDKLKGIAKLRRNKIGIN